MKILILTAIQGRQHITELFLLGIERLKIFSGHDIRLFCVCSEKEDSDFLKSKGVSHCTFENRPLSAKFDYGFKQALKYDFDYLMTLGSDDLLDHNIFNNYYNPLMQRGELFFGIKQIAIIDYRTLDCITYKYFINKGDLLLGAGRMIARSLCMEFKDKPLYNVKPKNNGLDFASELELKKHAKPLAVITERPQLIDVKSEVNIWSWLSVSKRQLKAEYDKITHFLSVEEDNYLRRSEMKIVAVIPVHGRLPLLKLTIKRLYERNKVMKVICIGSEAERATCEAVGAEFIVHDNNPLGKKWNAGFMAAKKYSPDGCLFVGSSDWISDNWLDYISIYMRDYDLVGKPDFNLLDYGHIKRACHWAGYNDFRRANEPIGIGRVLSRRILDAIGWKPMDDKLESSLDWSMYNKIIQSGGKIKLLNTTQIQSLSLSTHSWINKHKFEDHWKGKMPSKKIDVNKLIEIFPEINEL